MGEFIHSRVQLRQLKFSKIFFAGNFHVHCFKLDLRLVQIISQMVQSTDVSIDLDEGVTLIKLHLITRTNNDLFYLSLRASPGLHEFHKYVIVMSIALWQIWHDGNLSNLSNLHPLLCWTGRRRAKLISVWFTKEHVKTQSICITHICFSNNYICYLMANYGHTICLCCK